MISSLVIPFLHPKPNRQKGICQKDDSIRLPDGVTAKVIGFDRKPQPAPQEAKVVPMYR